MKIPEEHLSEPGLVVIDITAADVATATEAAAALGGLWLPAVRPPPGTPPARAVSPSAPMPTCDAHAYQRQLAPASVEPRWREEFA
ncbi:DUF6207 family protein [Streptomyces decoyicus]|uniref:DUF6207 family protein n=1 Tax=Streptomyces decoyicus TaxID=249567 RepID=UPI002E34695D|nr:DUF6207 family protein [Streptomyces decoyicus]